MTGSHRKWFTLSTLNAKARFHRETCLFYEEKRREERIL